MYNDMVCLSMHCNSYLSMVLTSLLIHLLQLTIQQIKFFIDPDVCIIAARGQGQLDILRSQAQWLQNVHLPVL